MELKKTKSSAPSFSPNTKLKIRTNACKVAARILAVKKSHNFFKRLKTNKYVQNRHGTFDWIGTSSSQLDSGNFRKSSSPARFMFLSNGEWEEFTKEATLELCEKFKAGFTSVHIHTDENKHTVNFVQMMQLNLLTGFLQSIAWIDENGKCFFPSKSFEGHVSLLQSHLQLKLPIGMRRRYEAHDSYDNESFSEVCDSSSDRRSINIDVDSVERCHGADVTSDMTFTDESKLPHRAADLTSLGTNFNPSTACDAYHNNSLTCLGDKLIPLGEDELEHKFIRSKLEVGMATRIHEGIISGIYLFSSASPSGQARFQAFSAQERITMTRRGCANVCLAWYKTSKTGVCSIVKHGFGQPQNLNNDNMYGVGVYLTPENHSFMSGVQFDSDENEEEYVILCRVILGNVEQVNPGSQQFHPSSEQYDTGVDNYHNPTRYIVWTTHMNTCIIPQYIISLKVSSQRHGIMASLVKQTNGASFQGHQRLDGLNGGGGVANQFMHSKTLRNAHPSSVHHFNGMCSNGQVLGSVERRAPRSPWMSFPVLFLRLEKKIPPSKLSRLRNFYIEFKAGRMSREMLIKNVRTVAGDHILIDCIRSMQQQELLHGRQSAVDVSSYRQPEVGIGSRPPLPMVYFSSTSNQAILKRSGEE